MYEYLYVALYKAVELLGEPLLLLLWTVLSPHLNIST
jgi:hypothetical protein